jgi:RHS repeat-associated protein
MTSGSSTNPYYFHTDTRGSVTAMTDNTGAQQWAYSYEPYGLIKSSTKVASSAPANPRQWLAELTDTGLGQTHLRARQYDPATGAFTSPDAGGTGAGYTYANANPLTNTDPLGLWPSPGSVLSGIHRVATDVAAVGGVAALACAATVVCAPADGIIGPIAGVAGAISAGTGVLLAVGDCQTAKSSCTSDLVSAGIGIAATQPGHGLGKAGLRAAESESGFVNLASKARTNHILNGEVRPNGSFGGGHRFGTGFPNKSEFPAGWSDDEIMHNISDVATDPSLTWRAGNGSGDFFVNGTRDGVDIEVLIRNGEIWTGYPTNLPRNP